MDEYYAELSQKLLSTHVEPAKAEYDDVLNSLSPEFKQDNRPLMENHASMYTHSLAHKAVLDRYVSSGRQLSLLSSNIELAANTRTNTSLLKSIRRGTQAVSNSEAYHDLVVEGAEEIRNSVDEIKARNDEIESAMADPDVMSKFGL